VVLAIGVSVIGKKKFPAVQAFVSSARRLHRFQNQKEPLSETAPARRKKNHREENSGRRRRKKIFQRILRRKLKRRKSTPWLPNLRQFRFAPGIGY
jgi:hypothetical protein